MIWRIERVRGRASGSLSTASGSTGLFSANAQSNSRLHATELNVWPETIATNTSESAMRCRISCHQVWPPRSDESTQVW